VAALQEEEVCSTMFSSVVNSSGDMPPVLHYDSIMRLMTVWRKTWKIIRTAIFDTYAQL